MEKNKSYKIGRFKIERLLGKGGQGSVFLALDTTLDRLVAVKTLKGKSSNKAARHSLMLQEARAVSKLQHPNIVPLYEAGEYKGISYLVFEYIEGLTLKDIIKRKESLSVNDAVKLMSQILDGVAYAHQHGIIHRDLKPGNILITTRGVPRVMDFGSSLMIGLEDKTAPDKKGTLRYMSPEHFSNAVITKSSDVFALGLILYEMLTSTPCFEAPNEFALIFKIINEPTVFPSLINPRVERALDNIVLKAVQKEPIARYPDAASMKEAIDTYLDVKGKGSEAMSAKADTQGILNFLLRRMRYKSDFPAFSKSVMEINEKTTEDSYTSARDLANVILKDYSLTNKLLKLVNSSFYGGLGKGVTSIAQAVVILGVEQVRLTAAATMLFTQMREKSAIQELRDAMVKSFMSGIVAMDLANVLKVRKMETGFLCAMFQDLGKNLTIYYFPEEYSEIKALMKKNGLDIHSAAHAVLGISLDELGVCVARHWKFPENIIYGMRRLPEGVVDKPNSTLEMLRHFSVFSNELCELAGNTAAEQRDYLSSQLVRRFEPSFSISEKSILTLLRAAIEKIKRYSAILNINPEQSPFIQRLFTLADNTDGVESPHMDEDPLHHKPAPAKADYGSVNNGDSGVKDKNGNEETQTVHAKRPVGLPLKLLQGLMNVAQKINWRQ